MLPMSLEADRMYRERLREQTEEVNAIFRWLMPAQWLFGLLLAALISPMAWEGLDKRVHPHVWAALAGGALLMSGPMFCLIRRPFARSTPHVVAVGQMLFSALLIHLTGGRLETHFHIFGSLAILAFYLDRGVLLTAGAVVVADHLLRGWFVPESVYGVASAGWWRSLEHGGWVVFEIMFLMLLTQRSVKRILRLAAESAAEQQAQQEGARRLRLVIESAYDAFAGMDPEGCITEWNQQACKTFGWKAEEVMGRPLSALILPDGRIEGNPLPADLRELADSGNGPGQGYRMELQAKHRDGGIFPIEITIAAASWKGSRLYHVFMRDITERQEHARHKEEMNQRLVEASRQAGKAEVAVGVLHNVGNVLNSVNVSAGVISDTVKGSRAKVLGEVMGLMRTQNGNLADFLTKDPRGRMVPELLDQLAQGLDDENTRLTREAASLVSHISHIRETVALQQSHATVSGITERLAPHRLLEDALKLEDGAMVRHGIEVIPEWEEVPMVIVDRHKTLQILVNLLRNAKQAMNENEARGRSRRLELKISKGREGFVSIVVRDNGIGIQAGDLTRIFGHGFTTRREGHGFGLHISALAAREMDAELTAESDGPGHGAAFTLHLPYAGKTTPGHEGGPSLALSGPASHTIKPCPAQR